jgi:hypothetical protein
LRLRGSRHVTFDGLDLDYFGAQIGEDLAGERAHDDRAQLQNSGACQEWNHGREHTAATTRRSHAVMVIYA